jgi:transposase
MVAAIAEAVIGPKPGMLIRRRAVSSFCASFAMIRPRVSVLRLVGIGSGFPNRRDFDSTCWLGGGQQEMAKPYSQDLRDRVIDAVKRGEMSRRAAARRYEISESVAIKWLERIERDGSREPVGHGGHRASKLMPHRAFLEAARAEKSDVTLQAFCDRLSAERGVKADTSMMSRFFRKIVSGLHVARRWEVDFERARQAASRWAA